MKHTSTLNGSAKRANLLFTKRWTMEDFPTDASPSSTSLYLRSDKADNVAWEAARNCPILFRAAVDVWVLQ